MVCTGARSRAEEEDINNRGNHWRVTDSPSYAPASCHLDVEGATNMSNYQRLSVQIC